MIDLPGFVLIINPSFPILLNSSFEIMDDISGDDDLPAIKEVDLPSDDKIE
jgi:hypothetical protein